MRSFLWSSFEVFDAILILLFIAAYAARFVHPQHLWWLQLLALGLPLLSLSIVAATAVVILAGAKQLAAFHLLLCLLIVIRYAPQGLAGLHSADGRNVLTVLTLNAKYKAEEPAAGARAFKTLLERDSPHVLCTQEISLQRNPVRSDTGVTSPVVYSAMGFDTVLPASQRILHHPVISRIKIEEVQRISLHPDRQSEFPNAVTKAHLMWHGRKVAVYNLHLQSFNSARLWRESYTDLYPLSEWPSILRTYRQDFLVRAREAEQLRRLLDEEELPFIVCGDFNSTPGMWVYHHLSKGLKDAFSRAGRGWGATFPAGRPLVRIDYILVSPEWTVLDAHTAGPVFSDHLPTVARIAL